MRRILNRMAHQVETNLEPSGLTQAQWLPLFMLSLGRASTAAEVARECDLDAGATTRMLDRLERKGLCKRERSLRDRRVVLLSLTPEGRKAAKRVPQVLSDVHNEALAGFTSEEWNTLKVLLRRMLSNAQAMSERRT
jgi:DNA-binding MarR family transcriptional regulator